MKTAFLTLIFLAFSINAFSEDSANGVSCEIYLGSQKIIDNPSLTGQSGLNGPGSNYHILTDEEEQQWIRAGVYGDTTTHSYNSSDTVFTIRILKTRIPEFHEGEVLAEKVVSDKSEKSFDLTYSDEKLEETIRLECTVF